MGEGGGFGWGGVEGWGEKAHNCNRITIKKLKLKKESAMIMFSSVIYLIVSQNSR